MASSWRDATSGMVTLTNVGDPPPPYTDTEGQGQRGRVILSVSWEPPPVYDIAIVAAPYEVCLVGGLFMKFKISFKCVNKLSNHCTKKKNRSEFKWCTF